MRSGVACLLIAAAALAGCEREERHFRAEIQNATGGETAPRRSSNQPAVALGGMVRLADKNISMYDDNAYAISEGKRLYHWYNCSGCHANGGGAIGPPLMDSQWTYGSDPQSIFNTIMQGRANGMPSFGGHIPDDQVWKIVAYVRSMGGAVRTDVAPSRGDSLYPGKPENFRSPQPAVQKGVSESELALEPR
ncbi:c-type cytochrome [Ramlibacter alkalitolerans]|jgi:cytochrome c oxidase cbb3-type subunit 3|uniref:Cytochrome c n=1 Tax=Ramlibacter alkalitolerans TaxID=2039631 RepID=A0ABS1JHW6_9BURK|nr:c-type cytochrome [Ramlibacter alkalitolerans]MBL0423804.1 cytochrome c [Ramlibacter alkalitolerans]